MAGGGTWMWTGLVVWVVSVFGARGGRAPSACNIRCCNFSPACIGATHMSCHCPDTHTMMLRSGYIPNTVEYIEILSAQSVTIARRALYDLHHLRDLTVRDIGSLEVLSDGLALPESSSLQTLRLERLRRVTLRQDALSGHWPQSAEMSVHHVGYMHLEQQALHFEADGPGPSMLLEDVSNLHAKGDAFRAAMRQLSLVNVSMGSCQPGTFRGRVKALNLLGCSLRSIESRCIQPDERWERVSITTCDVGDVREGALTGDVGALLLEATNVSRLHRSAVKMSLQRLEVKRVHVRDMEALALDVSVCVSVEIMESRVGELRQHALAGVRLTSCRRQDMRPFTIHLLHVGTAESGSLAVHESVPASAVNWDSITFDTACSCEMREDISTLVTGKEEEKEDISNTQRALTDIIWERSFCSGAGGRPERLTDATADCSGSWEGPGDQSAGDSSEETSLDQDVVFYGVIAGASALVLALVSFLFTKRRCVGRTLGCTGEDGGGGGKPASDTLQSRRTAYTVANSTLSSAAGASSLERRPRHEEGLPDLVTAAPGVDLSPADPETQHALHAAHEHIYDEIDPRPTVADYADPRDSVAMEQGDEAAPEREQYAEIAPLVGRPEPPPPPPNPPLAENELYARTGDKPCPVTHL